METQNLISKSSLNSTKYNDRKISIDGKKNSSLSPKLAILFLMSILFIYNYSFAGRVISYELTLVETGSISLADDWLITQSFGGEIVNIDVYNANSELEGSFVGCLKTKCTNAFDAFDEGIYFVVVTTTNGSFSGTIIK